MLLQKYIRTLEILENNVKAKLNFLNNFRKKGFCFLDKNKKTSKVVK